ncbi:ABC transporter substrate-binding protein [Labedella endophytica]|uniref:Carbohydrate ABC transporter substrate-binding protein n=1 Tax=Labedella endophytica TaxID=1523160 RepID=A0A433JSJ3_9MICO|nr:ABC transporter substrate-binding protein [Labedella endophytica]RUR01007.1 carbohydrate ABC transporter substrate-binding protein [Labedella endophytica]
MKSRSLAATLAASTALVLAGSLSACSGGSGTDGKAVLEFQTAQSVDSPVYAQLEAITAAFEEENPDVDIDLKTGADDYEPQMKVRLAARNAPDIWATHGWSLLRYSQFLAPLQDEPWAENFDDVLEPVMKNDSGEFFALPVTTSASGLIYNRTVLEDAGVDPAGLTSWDALADAAEAVKANGVVPFSLAGSKDGSAGNLVDWIAPGGFTDDELAKMSDGEFQEDAYADLLGVLADMKTDGWTNVDYTSATGDDMARSLAEGTSAFALSTNALVTLAWTYNPDADLSYMPVPPLDGGDPYLIGGEDTAFGVAKDGDNVEIAKEYLAFLAQPENASALAAAVGNPPGLTNAEPDLGALTDPFEQYVASGTVPLEPFFDRVYLPNGMWDSVVTTADGVLAAQSTPAEGAAKMAGDFDTLFSQSSN